jgi:hypothetical protein
MSTFQAPFKWLICFTRVNIFGTWHDSSISAVSHQPKLDDGKIVKLVGFLRSLDASSPELVEAILKQADYFEENAERMRYPEFRQQHLFVGSGVIEAGCKAVIGSRLKQSGMFWTVRGANAIIALRCCLLNREHEDYWANRRRIG